MDGAGAWGNTPRLDARPVKFPSKETLDLIDGLERTSTYIVVSEETGRPYDKNTFGRIFRKFRRRAGISNVTFPDLRRTVATEL